MTRRNRLQNYNRSTPYLHYTRIPTYYNSRTCSCVNTYRPRRGVDHYLRMFQLFCRIVEQYISAWYVNISSDTWFQFEIRSAIRRIVCDVYGRINQVSVPSYLLVHTMYVRHTRIPFCRLVWSVSC